MKDTTLVIGASLNPERYSNKAVRSLHSKGFQVVAIGLRSGVIDGVTVEKDWKHWSSVQTVSLYVSPKYQPDYYDYILSLEPERVIFNPGTENDEFEKILQQNNIHTEIACTLVLLNTNQYI